MESAKINAEYENGILKIIIKGEIDHHCAKSIREESDAKIFYYRPKTLVIELSGVDFMDSSGLGYILGRFSVMQSIGGKTEVEGASPKTEKILKLAGIEKMIKIKTGTGETK